MLYTSFVLLLVLFKICSSSVFFEIILGNNKLKTKMNIAHRRELDFKVCKLFRGYLFFNCR